MSKEIPINDKKSDVIKAEYYELMSRILDVWLKIPPESDITADVEFELSILEDLALEYVKVMQERGIYVAEWIGGDE